MDIKAYKQLKYLSKEIDGVFSQQDLKVALGMSSDLQFYRLLKRLVEQGELTKIKRGFYYTQDADLISIANRLYSNSYISTGTVLAKYGAISSVPAKRVQAIKTGEPRKFSLPIGTIEYLSISPKLFFGFENRDGIRIATIEKAFIDLCYFYYKGKRFSFNPQTDINLETLDLKIAAEYMQRYDQRFKTYFDRMWCSA